MQLMQKLKICFKDTIKRGKIVRVATKDAPWTRPLSDFASRLSGAEWKEFEEQEVAFRKSLSGQGTFYGQFVCKGDFIKWKKVIKLINGIFTKGGGRVSEAKDRWDPLGSKSVQLLSKDFEFNAT